MEIGIKVVTDRRVALKFDQFPKQAHDALLDVITSCTEQLRGMVEARVPKRTGRLASEVHSRVQDYPDRITGIVEIAGDVPNDYGKAAALEYGAHGSTHVREHAEKLNHLFGKLMAPMTVLVSAHDRKLNISEHEFMRGPLEEMADDFLTQMKEAVQMAVEE